MYNPEIAAEPHTSAAWATDEDVPDPTNLPQVLGWRILVRPKAPKEKVGSILLADTSKEAEEYNNIEGRVLATGPMCWRGDGKDRTNDRYWYGGPWAKVGDRVVYSKYTGQRIIVNGVKLVILDDDSITAVLPEGVTLTAYV